MDKLLTSNVQGYPFQNARFSELLNPDEPTLLVFLRHFG